MACDSSSERALPRGRGYQLPLCSTPSLWRAARASPLIILPRCFIGSSYGAWPVLRASSDGPVIICRMFPLPICIARSSSAPANHLRGRKGQLIICSCYGPSLKQALRSQPSYHLPVVYVSFAHLSGTRPKGASLSCAFLLCMTRGPNRARLSSAFLLYMARSPSGPAYLLPLCPNCGTPRPCENASSEMRVISWQNGLCLLSS